MRWQVFDGSTVAVACFAIGDGGEAPAGGRHRAHEEAMRTRDIVWLPTHEGVVGGAFVKQLDWWKAASRLLDGAEAAGGAYAAKVDDDTFLHLPAVLSDLTLLRCLPHVYYGSLSFAGFDPLERRPCGCAGSFERARNAHGPHAHARLRTTRLRTTRLRATRLHTTRLRTRQLQGRRASDLRPTREYR